MRRRPGFYAAAILTLSLGIAANSAIFSICNAVLFKPLPYPEPEQLVMAWERSLDDGGIGAVTPADFVDWPQRSRSFAHLAALDPFPNFNLTGQGEAERLAGAAVSANLFDLFGIRLAMGRSFLAEEDRPGNNRVVVLSHGLWERRFRSDPNLVGATITLNERPYVVVGVLPADFQFVGQSADFQARTRFDVWVPLALDPARLPLLRETHPLRVFGRLAPEVSLARAQADLSAVASQLEQEHPSSNKHRGVEVVKLSAQVVRDVQTGLLTLQIAVAVVLLIACANVASLLLARAGSRQAEFAVRIALGAGARRLYQQTLTEASVLAMTGGALGLLSAWWGVELFRARLPEMPRVGEIALDTSVLLFTFATTLCTALVFGAAPLFHQRRMNVGGALKHGGRTVTGQSSLRSALVVGEIAFAALLLVGAALIVQSFWRLSSVQPGFRTDHLLTAHVSLPWSRYKTPALAAGFHDQVLEGIRAFPGVLSAGGAAILPLGGTDNTWGFHIEHQPNPRESAKYRPITPGYLETMGIPIGAGRTLTERDTAIAPRVVLISETMKRKYFPDQDAIGQRLRLLDPTMEWRTIVGVVGDVRDEALEKSARSVIYVPHTQTPFPVLDLSLVTRTAAADPLTVAGGIRQVVHLLDPNQPIYGITTMENVVEAALGQPRFRSSLVGGFAAVALLLACIGIYGVMAQTVAGRTREFGVRLALGATPRELAQQVLRQTGILAAIGLTVGLSGAALMTRLTTSLLYEVSALDPGTYISIAVALGTVALLAGSVPARRAGRVDVIRALRQE
jgi:putative ABC transport system permease protein